MKLSELTKILYDLAKNTKEYTTSVSIEKNKDTINNIYISVRKKSKQKEPVKISEASEVRISQTSDFDIDKIASELEKDLKIKSQKEKKV